MIVTDNYALITGASGGVGLEFAKMLAIAGWKLILVSRNKAKLEEVKASLSGKNASNAVVLPCDLSKDCAAEALYKECSDKGLVVDLLVNNAGLGVFGQCVDILPSELTKMVNLNIVSLTNLSDLFGKDMRERKCGQILNVGSFAGLNATPYFASYAATKSYVINYSLALRSELKPFGVYVSCLLPGYISTAFDNNAGVVSEAYKKFSNSNSMTAEAVAKVGIHMINNKKAYRVAGFRNRFASAFFKILPRTASAVIMKPILDKLV